MGTKKKASLLLDNRTDGSVTPWEHYSVRASEKPREPTSAHLGGS